MLLTVLTDSYFEYLKSERNVSDKTVNSYNSDWQDFYHYLEREKYHPTMRMIKMINTPNH